MKFEELNLDEKLLKGIKDTGFEECMPVQELTFAETFKGRDVLVQSQTGSGKTAAFLITIFKLFLDEDDPKSKRALIIVPTRELAVQIEKEAELLGRHLDFSIGSFYGGVGYTTQERKLREGVNIIVGTPGRLIDFGEMGKLKFKEIDMLIIDEADRLFDMGFYPDIRRMLRKMGPLENRKTMLFSATLSNRVRNLSWEHMKDPAEVTINPEEVTVEKITQELYHVGRHEKMKLLLGILKKENPENVLIFTNTKQAAYEVAMRLNHNGMKAQYIIGDLPQSKRLRIIDDMKEGNIPILVATDVAARGLHVDDLDLVINYDIPEDCENYVHRVGRTARAGKTGKAISLSCERYVYGLDAIESFTGIKIPVSWADDEDYLEDASVGKYFDLQKERNKGRERDRGRDGRQGQKKPNRDKTRQSGQRQKTERKRQPGSVIEGGVQKSTEGARTPSPRKGIDQRRKNKGAPQKGAPQKGAAAQKGNRQPQKKEARNKQNVRANPRGNMEERLAYYSQKYGEDFKVEGGPSVSEKKKNAAQKKRLSDRIKGIFSRK